MSDYTGGENPYVPLYGASNTPYDVSNTPRHEVLNYEGTPTQFSDDTGLRAILTRKGIMDISSFNPILKPGEKPSASTARQATNDEGQLLFLDAEGNQTTRPTETPMVGGSIGDAAYMKKPRSGGGVFGDIGADFVEMAKDPQFHKFLLTAAAIGTGGLAANAAFGVGGIGAGLGGGATAFPVSSGALLPATELGTVGTGTVGAGGVGSLTAGMTPEMIAAGEAALPETMADIGGLSGSLTDAQATSLMEQGLLPESMQTPASQGITATQALRGANLARSGLSALTNATSKLGSGLGGLAGPALAAALAALAAKSRNAGSVAPSETPPVNPVTFNWNYKTPEQTDQYVARGQQILAPQYTATPMATGGTVRMFDGGNPPKEGSIIPKDILKEILKDVPTSVLIKNLIKAKEEVDDEYESIFGDLESRDSAIQPHMFHYKNNPDKTNLSPTGAMRNPQDLSSEYFVAGATVPAGIGSLGADLYGSRINVPGYRRDGIDAAGLSYDHPVGENGNIRGSVISPLNKLSPNIMLNYQQRFAQGGISDLGGYSDGGRMLKGPGDGMSDSIPASIENKRPARLATDEFVVPADVVSHLGNGSSEAGAKVLYAMMDKVRRARTGHATQGKQINPSKFMPG